MKNRRPLKFSETLASLIEARGYTGARKKICAEVGVSPSALTQYLQGQSRPSLETLLALADFFEVGLDYLVYGTREAAAAAVDYGPAVRYIDMALADLQTKSDQHAVMFTRIARVLSDQIEGAADKVAAASPNSSGLLRDDETMLLESYSLECWVAGMNLQDEIIDVKDKPPALGRFLTTVANNLRLERRYHYLMSSRVGDWKPVVNAFLQMLQQHAGDAQLILDGCKFRISRLPMYSGCGIYKLHVRKLAAEQPILYERVREAISEDDWIGYLVPPSREMHADALMDRFHLFHARKAFEKLWRAGEPL